jgi:hypothetical protein
MSPQPAPPAPPAPNTPIGSFLPAGLKDLALKALVASATAIGFTGFVAVLGGAILWVRFYSARLPADQAIAVMPTGDLVVFGAVTLVTFFVLGGLTVLASYLLDPHAGPTASTRRILITLVAIEMAYAIAITPFGDNWKRLGLIALVAVIGVAGELALTKLGSVDLTSSPRKCLGDKTTRWPYVAKIGLYLLVVVAIAGAVLLANPELWLGGVLLVAALLGRAVMRVARLSGNNFGWYGVALFLSVVLFGAALNVLRTIDLPQVQPAALLRENDAEGVCGLYITETDDRIYLARTDLAEPEGKRPIRTSGRIFWVPREDVTDFSVGSLQSIRDAEKRAPVLRRELLLDRQPQIVSVETTVEKQTSPPSDEGQAGPGGGATDDSGASGGQPQKAAEATTTRTRKFTAPKVREAPKVPDTVPCAEPAEDGS